MTERSIYDEIEQMQADITALQTANNALQTDVENLRSEIDLMDGGARIIEENTDLNSLTEGKYYIPNANICATLLNRPDTTGQTATIDVLKGGDTGQLVMIYQPCLKENSKRYIRCYYANTWGSWLVDDNNDTGWINLPLNNGWTMNDYTAEIPQYRKIGKIVYLRGLVNATSAAGTIIATLPAGFRPAGYFGRFACTLNQTEYANVQVNANGVINDYQKGTKGRAYLSLYGISFPQVY